LGSFFEGGKKMEARKRRAENRELSHMESAISNKIMPP
jgi:hypothetical protein